MYSVDTLRSNEHDQRERGDWWRDQVSSTHCPMAFSLADSYQGTLQHQHSDTYQLVRWWGEAEVLSRTAADIRRHPHGAYELLLPVRGEVILEQDRREARSHRRSWLSHRWTPQLFCAMVMASLLLHS